MADTPSLAQGFEQLLASGRGNHAKGRNLQALLLLNLCWSQSQMPLNSYRPKKNPAAFLALIFEALDTLNKQDTAYIPNPSSQLQQSLKSFVQDLSAEFPQLGQELLAMLKTVLLDKKRSSLSRYFQRLAFYLSPEELLKVKPERVIEEMSLAEVFNHLGYVPPELGAGVERHPIGKDMRKALRSELDGLWSKLLKNVKPEPVQLAACFPLNFWGLAERLPTPLPDFTFFYALMTNAHLPGRTWTPPLSFLGADDAREPFDLLMGDTEYKNSRLGLSATLPETVAVFDSWLELERFQTVLCQTHWRTFFREQPDAIRYARLKFLALFEDLRS